MDPSALDAWLGSAAANGIGAVGVVVYFGLLISRGNLIPRSTHREAMAGCHEQIRKADERADRWEAVALRALEATERLADPTHPFVPGPRRANDVQEA